MGSFLSLRPRKTEAELGVHLSGDRACGADSGSSSSTTDASTSDAGADGEAGVACIGDNGPDPVCAAARRTTARITLESCVAMAKVLTAEGRDQFTSCITEGMAGYCTYGSSWCLDAMRY